MTRRMMIIVGAVCAVAAATYCAVTTQTSVHAQEQVVLPQTEEVGRYQIVMRDGVRADTFLLDTTEGRVWVLTALPDLAGEPSVWLNLPRFDRERDFLDWASARVDEAEMRSRLKENFERRARERAASQPAQP